ncbi:MAG: glucose-1-phosphate thymidylyltransferase, partial [Chloroflexota bacterium]
IGPQVCILPSTCVGNNSVIHPFTWVKNSLIADNVVIGPHSSVEDSIVSAGVVVGGHFSAQTGSATVAVNGEFLQVNMGVVLGDNCRVEGNVVAQPGTIIGINSNIRSMKTVGGSLPDGSLVV